MNLQRVTFSAILAVILVVVLIYGQSLILPFILSLLIWFIIKEIRELFQRIHWVQQKVPTWVLSTVGFIMIVGVLGMVSQMLTSNIKSLSKSLPSYEKELNKVGQLLKQNLGVDYRNTLTEYASSIDFASIIELLINSLTDLIGNAVMILIYLVFLLLEEQIFSRKLKALYTDGSSYHRVIGILNKIDRSVGKYITLKTLVSFITGLCSYIALLIIGVEAALFWSVLIFLLNYIPTVGSLIGTLFPAFFALLQFGNVTEMLYVLSVVGLIQIIVGNAIEPEIMGESLNLSALVVILSLSFWGAIWGISGMILSVPITVGIVIVCAAFSQTKPIAILLSEKGEV